MANPAPPQGDYTELSQLAARISQHLLKHPADRQARADLHYVVMQMQGPTGATAAANAEERRAVVGPESLHPGAEVTAGVTQAALDIPRGILQGVTHPIQALGQLTGIGNWGNLVRTFKDPEADTAEKLDAIMRSLPTNIGYAPERGLLEATGAKADTPASVQEQAHRAANMATFLVAGVSPKLVGRIAGRIPVVGPLGRAAAAAVRRAGPAAPGGTPQEVALANQLQMPVSQVAGRVGPEAFKRPFAPMPYSPISAPRPMPEPMDVPTFMRRPPAAPIENGGLLAPSPQSAPLVAGRAAIPGRPDLGLLAPAGPYQTAGSPLRTVTPSAPMAGPLATGPQLALQVQLARAMGMTEAAIAARLARLGITPRQVQAALR